MPQATATRTARSGSLIIVSIFLEKLADRAEPESDFQVGIGCGQIFEICCADIAETDPILLQSTKMEGRTRGRKDRPGGIAGVSTSTGRLPHVPA